MAKNKKPSGDIPNSVLSQVGEHTIGGFILFYFNSETGEPEQVMNFDSPAHCLALQKYIADWHDAIHTVTLNNSIDSIHRNIQEINKKKRNE